MGLYSEGIEVPYEYELHELDGTITTKISNFQPYQSWGNEYTPDFKMKGKGSFRIFDLDIEDTAKAFEEEGWVRFERGYSNDSNGK